MKNPILCLAACLILLCSCQKNADSLPEKASTSPPDAISSSGFTQYTIAKGAHYASNNTYKVIETNELQFIVKFDSTAIYQSVNVENQYDINKLYGFSDNNDLHHNYSARFGWNWSQGALHLYGYVYNEGKVSSKELGVVPVGADVFCAVRISAHAYQFYINDRLATVLPRAATTPKASGYLLYPYFGGDEAAPHNVDIWIMELSRVRAVH